MDLGGTSSPGKNSAHICSAVSEESIPMMSASRRKSSISRVLAANAFIAKMWRGEAAVTRKPGWSNTRRLPGSSLPEI